MRQELAFAAKIPEGDELRRNIEGRLTSATPDWLTDAALRECRIKGEFEMARYAHIPNWVVRAAQCIREKRASRRR